MRRITGTLDEGRITFIEKPSETEGKTRDPVCGKPVEPTRAAGAAMHRSRAYYFCSETCRRRFEADPDRYTG
jgi:P-type Cu+ transporter